MSLIRTHTSLPLWHTSPHLLLRSLVHFLGWNGDLKTKPAIKKSIPNPAFRTPNQQHPLLLLLLLLLLLHPLKHYQQEEAKLERHRMRYSKICYSYSYYNQCESDYAYWQSNIESCFQFILSILITMMDSKRKWNYWILLLLAVRI